MRVFNPRFRRRNFPKSSVLKQTFPPPVEERVQSRQMRIALAPARHVPAPSTRVQVLAPPPPAPPENYFTRVMRTVFARPRHVRAPSTRWKTFPPPIFERIQSRLMRVVFASRKRAPGQGQVLKQTFPPPVEENVIRRMMRTVFAPRRRAPGPSMRIQVLAPPIVQPDQNYFTRVLRRVFALSRHGRAPSKKVQVLAPPPPPPPGGLIPFLRSFRLQGRDRKRSGQTKSRIFIRLFSLPPVPTAAQLKRIAGWFRNFLRVG